MNLIRKCIRSFIPLLVLLPLNSPSPIAVLASDTAPIELVCGVTTVDGVIQPGEWPLDAAQLVSLLGSQGERSATIYMMNSHDTLYLGIEVDDDELSETGLFLPNGDYVRIDFDNDGGGLPFTLGEEVLSASAAAPHFFDQHLAILPGSTTADIDAGGTSDGSAAVSRVDQRNHFELQHPLCSGDALDVCLQAGDIFSLRLEYLDAQTDEIYGGSYFYPEYSSTVFLQVSECTATERIVYLPLSLK